MADAFEERSIAIYAESLARGRNVPDLLFDRVYPEAIQALSRRFWTPVRVARRAVELLEVSPGARVLDVGAGVGKFCLVGALTSQGEFTGVEQREALVEVARAAAVRCGAVRARFVCDDMTRLEWGEYQGIYLFNPFAENYFEENEQIDAAVDLSWERYAQDVATVEWKLRDVPNGTRVVTYHGFGGEFPRGFVMTACEECGTGLLECWVRAGA